MGILEVAFFRSVHAKENPLQESAATTSDIASDLRSLKIETIDDVLSDLAEFSEKLSNGGFAAFTLMPVTITFDLQDDRALGQLEESLDWLLKVAREARNRVKSIRRRDAFPQ